MERIYLRNQRVLLLVEIAIFGALAFVLDFVAFKMPQGGSVSLAMIPLIVMAFRRGVVAGILTGLLFGLLQILAGPSVTPLSFGFLVIQVILDYLAAFAVVGLAGMLKGTFQRGLHEKKNGTLVTAVVIGTFIGLLLRYVIHVITGVLFFGMYTDGNVLTYSLIYNATYMVPLFLLTAIACSILFMAAPRLANPER